MTEVLSLLGCSSGGLPFRAIQLSKNLWCPFFCYQDNCSCICSAQNVQLFFVCVCVCVCVVGWVGVGVCVLERLFSKDYIHYIVLLTTTIWILKLYSWRILRVTLQTVLGMPQKPNKQKTKHDKKKKKKTVKEEQFGLSCVDSIGISPIRTWM